MAVEYRCCRTGFLVRVGILILLVLFSGLMSGLKSLSLVDLEVLAKSGTPDDRKHATKILPVMKRRHLLYCTLLICNAAAMEALPIFLDSLVPAWGASLISVTLILMFVEIIPQAVFSRHGLAIGAAMAPVLQLLVWICFPVAYPISKLLDLLLGKGHVALFRRPESKTPVDLQCNEAGKGGELPHDEITINVDHTEKIARDARTPISDPFPIDINSELDETLMKLILEKGYSIVFVYHEEPRNITGFILVKNLLMIHPDDEVPLRNGPIRQIPRVPDTMSLHDILNEFQRGHSHMDVVVRPLNMNQSTSESLVPEVKVDVDGDDPNKNLKSLTSLKRLKSFQNDANPQRGNGIHSEVLPFDADPLLGLTEEAGAIGIITSEDVIEEHLQEEIYNQTDHLDERHY